MSIMSGWMRHGGVAMIGLVLALSLTSVAKSDGGEFEINALCVPTGCFSGDAPGFPVEIQSSGVYELTSDLDLTTIADGSTRFGILVRASQVRLDLSGFSLNGSSVCTGGNPDCTLFPFSETGIFVENGWADIVIEQGSINGMSRGVEVENSLDLVIRDLRISNTAGTGLVAQGSGFIEQVRVGNNGGRGILLNSPSFHVRDSLFINNGDFGVDGGYCSRNIFVTNSTASSNAQENCLFLIENNFCEAAPC